MRQNVKWWNQNSNDEIRRGELRHNEKSPKRREKQEKSKKGKKTKQYKVRNQNEKSLQALMKMTGRQKQKNWVYLRGNEKRH